MLLDVTLSLAGKMHLFLSDINLAQCDSNCLVYIIAALVKFNGFL